MRVELAVADAFAALGQPARQAPAIPEHLLATFEQLSRLLEGVIVLSVQIDTVSTKNSR